MHIEMLKISNFRGVKFVELDDLRTTVIVAGTNGSGKSTLFDAIRLLKSVYGGYQPNEIAQWLGEFQVNLSNPKALTSLLNDKSKDLEIEVRFSFAQEEKSFVQDNYHRLARDVIWRLRNPQHPNMMPGMPPQQAGNFYILDPSIEAQVNQLHGIVQQQLAQPAITAKVTINPQGNLQREEIFALTLLFSSYEPGNIGLIDYNGPQRTFNREPLQGVNINLSAQPDQQGRMHGLYNYSNKYNNIKTEMAAAYVRAALAHAAAKGGEEALLDPTSTIQNDLNATMVSLFRTFFPEKDFTGPRPTADGLLDFPVTVNGAEHDLNELSAGEKEILYGYLRLRSSAPRYSIILLDEPELHLNPKLIRRLPAFYNQHLGLALSNQIWLVTHSDALLREIKDDPSYSIFHMGGMESASTDVSQATRLALGSSLEKVVFDLVGDLATYRPGGKLVIFEGGGDSEFDLRMTTRLFPELLRAANCVSGDNKTKLRALHTVLETASEKALIPFKVYSIVDRDADGGDAGASSMFTWNVYHIENYLLDPKVIYSLGVAFPKFPFQSVDAVQEGLYTSAAKTLPQLTYRVVQDDINSRVRPHLTVKVNPQSDALAYDLASTVSRGLEKLSELVREQLDEAHIQGLIDVTKGRLEGELLSGEWKSSFPGRNILKRFVDDAQIPMSYEAFRDLIISAMVAQSVKPAGMQSVISEVVSAPS